MYFLSMEMIQIRTEIRGMWFPEKPSLEKSSIAGTKDLTLCRPVCYRLRHATSTLSLQSFMIVFFSMRVFKWGFKKTKFCEKLVKTYFLQHFFRKQSFVWRLKVPSFQKLIFHMFLSFYFLL